MFLRCGISSHLQPESCCSCLVIFIFIFSLTLKSFEERCYLSEVTFRFLIHSLLIKCSSPGARHRNHVEVKLHPWIHIAESCDQISFFPPVARHGILDFGRESFSFVVCIWFHSMRGSQQFQQELTCTHTLQVLQIELCVLLVRSVWQVVVCFEYGILFKLLVCTERMKQSSLLMSSPPSLRFHSMILTSGTGI